MSLVLAWLWLSFLNRFCQNRGYGGGGGKRGRTRPAAGAHEESLLEGYSPPPPAPALRLHYCYCYWYTHRDPLRWREPPPLSCLTAGGIGSVYQKAFLTTPTGIFPEYSPVNPLENVKLLRDEQKRVYTCSLSCMQRKTNAIDHAKLCRNGYIARFWTIWNQEPYLVKCNKLHHLTRRPKVICAQSRLLSFIRHVLVQIILRQEHHSQPGAILE